MKARTILVAVATAIAGATVMSGCAVSRGQSTVGAYVDDKAITAAVKAKFLADPQVGGLSLNVDTLNGEVMLSGFAKNVDEKMAAERLARDTRGVKGVRNQIVVRG